LPKLKLAISMFIFGTIGVFVKYIPLSSSVIALTRGLIGTFFLLLVVIISKSKLSIKEVKSNFCLLILSGAAIGINWILLFEAYKYTTVATATLCYYFAPVFVIALSPFILKEKLTLKKGLCITGSVIGMALVSGIFHVTPAGANDIKGILFGLAAASLYASVVLMNKFLKNISPLNITIVQLAVAAVVLIPYVLLTENIAGVSFKPLTLVLLVAVGVIHTGVAYYLYFSSMKDIKGQTIAIFSYIDPVVAIILSSILLRESLTVPDIIGAVLILGSTLVSELDFK